MIDSPMEYRPTVRWTLWPITLALFAAPVPVYYLSQTWLLVLLVALVTWPSAVLAIVLFRNGPFLRVTDEGVYLRNYDGDFELAWSDIRGFEVDIDNLVIRTYKGGTHHVTWMTRNPLRGNPDLSFGHPEEIAEQLNGLLRLYTGELAQDDA